MSLRMTYFTTTTGPGPLVAAALHDGHEVSPDTRPHLAIDEATRLREEDPFTAELTTIAETRIIARHSRFEVDFNRPPEKAVYREPEDAWGLQVWRGPVPETVIQRSMRIYETFYAAVEGLLETKVRQYGAVVVYDIHSFNHRREGRRHPSPAGAADPDVNVGTGSLDRERWGPLVERFMGEIRAGARDEGLGELDVQENAKFRGGHFPRWVHDRFGSDACVLAIEFKKTFMDEWTGEADREHLRRLRNALDSTVPGTLESHATISARS